MIPAELIVRCADALQWLNGDELRNTHWVHLTNSTCLGAWLQIRELLLSLWQAALDVGSDPPITAEEVRRATHTSTPKALGVLEAMAMVKRLQEWAISRHTAANRTEEQRLPANGARVPLAEVPAELRELGRAEGPALTSTYLGSTGGWDFSSAELTKAYQDGELTYRLKVGRAYAYLFSELFRLREKRAGRHSEV
jgi:hypothetical protein